MRARHVQQLPTLLSLSTAAPAEVLALLTSMRRAVADGLPVAFGTDAGVIPHGTNAREFEHFASIGLDAASALRAATLDAARAVGMAGEIGVLAPGRKADVIGVAGNLLEDIRTLQHVSFVIKDGRVFKDDSRAAGDIK
jgi:imidazolonepropionase-like amidohydrolase